MSDTVAFELADDDSFYVIVGDGVPATVYESYDDAVANVQDKLDNSADAFVAQMSFNSSGDDVEVNFSQVEWPKIIADME